MAAPTDTADPTNPADMTHEQRLTEVCAILTQGVIRLRRSHLVTSESATSTPSGDVQIPLESREIGLDDCAETSPHGQHG